MQKHTSCYLSKVGTLFRTVPRTFDLLSIFSLMNLSAVSMCFIVDLKHVIVKVEIEEVNYSLFLNFIFNTHLS